MCAIYDNGIKRLAKAYQPEFCNQGEGFLVMIGRFASIRGVLVSLYNILVKEGLCTGIENLE